MSDFIDFSMGEGDDNVGKTNKRFSAEEGRTYRASFVWFSVKTEDGWDDEAAWLDDGSLNPEAQIRFTGCERMYIKGVGYVLYGGPAFAQFGRPKQSVATIILVWPTDKEGDLDVASFKSGKGWTVHPWIFSTTKYQTIKKNHKRFSLLDHDLSMSCAPGKAQYQDLNFTPEGESLFRKVLDSEKAEYKALAQKMISEIKAVADSIHNDLARKMTVDQVREALGNEVENPTGSDTHAAKDVDKLLDNVL